MHVGDVQKRMMEKIEELTLYVIEQDKQIKKMESTISELIKRIDMAQAIPRQKKKLWKILLLLVCFNGFCFQGFTQRDSGSIAPSPEELRRNPQIKALFDSINSKFNSSSLPV